jgi:arylformamidase
MIRQSQDYAAARKAAGLPAHFKAIAGASHYTMLDDLASPNGELHRTVLSALR